MQSAASDLPLLEAAAREAGAIAREAFGAEVRAWDKGGDQPVSEIDLAINALLERKLRGARPDYGWLSEESEDTPDRQRRQRVFVVDPLDGTRAFLAGEPQFVIAIGVADRGRAAAGVVYNPITDEMFSGAEGAGAALNGAPIKPSTRDVLEGAAILAYPSVFKGKKWREPWPTLHLTWKHSVAYRLALIAAGRFDGAVMPTRRHLWDITAGAAILSAAGALVTDAHGRAIDYNPPGPPEASGLVAAGPALHALLIERTAHLPDQRADSISQEAAS